MSSFKTQFYSFGAGFILTGYIYIYCKGFVDSYKKAKDIAFSDFMFALREDKRIRWLDRTKLYNSSCVILSSEISKAEEEDMKREFFFLAGR